jgi:hypothetical protein
VVGSVPVVVGRGGPGTAVADGAVAAVEASAGPAVAEPTGAGPAVAEPAAAGPAVAEPAGAGPVAYWVSAARTCPEAEPAAGAGAPARPAGTAEPGSADVPGVVAAARSALAEAVGAGVAGTATLSAAAMSEVGSELGAAAGPAVLASESSAVARRPDWSESDPSRSPPFVEVFLLWPSASAVRATLSDRTLANASVGGGAPVGGPVPWPVERTTPPVLPAPGADDAAPAEGVSVVAGGIREADPMPGLMLPSGESR